MAEHLATTTVAHPWRRTARSVFQAVVTLAAIVPGIYQAATQDDPASATGFVGGGLVVAAGVTRVMALPSVEGFLQRFVPLLAADDVARDQVVSQLAPTTVTGVAAGQASDLPTGTPVQPPLPATFEGDQL